MADGPEHGLQILDAIEASGALGDYHLFHAARADLFRRAGRLTAAAESYRRALGLTSLEAERRFLARRPRTEIGRASCRGRGEISGVAGSLKKKKRTREKGKRKPHVI